MRFYKIQIKMKAKIKIEFITSNIGVKWGIIVPVKDTPLRTISTLKELVNVRFPYINVMHLLERENLTVFFVLDATYEVQQQLLESVYQALLNIYDKPPDHAEITVFKDGVLQESEDEKVIEQCELDLDKERAENISKIMSMIHVTETLEGRFNLELRLGIKVEHSNLQELISFVKNTLKILKIQYGLDARFYNVTPDSDIKALWQNIRFIESDKIFDKQMVQKQFREEFCKLFLISLNGTAEPSRPKARLS